MKSAGQILAMLLLAAMLFSAVSEAAYLRDIPRVIVQPNGDSVTCFISGDEFYRRLHDTDGFTIVKDQVTRYWVYAEYENEKAIPSAKIVGIDVPGQNNMKHGADPLPDDYQTRIDDFRSILDASKAPTLGDFNNLSVLIRFADDSEFVTPRSYFDSTFNEDTAPSRNSLRNYYWSVSRQRLHIETTIYPSCDSNTNLSYQDSKERNYYQPYDSIDNEDGYTDFLDRMDREQDLLRDALEAIKAEIPVELDIDGDADGFVDNICFIIRGGTGDWGDLLWPHRYQIYKYEVDINGAKALDYNLQIEWAYDVSVLCHELFHSMGAPDLYHYDSAASHLNPVGSWDLMEWNADPPQYTSSYMQFKYGHWIDSIPVISEPGVYKLNVLGMADSNVYRINSPYSTDEFFIVEFRSTNWNIFERSIPKIGMLVYRINNTVHGNAEGPPDEVYLFRPDGSILVDGRINDANLSPAYLRTAINDTTNPACYLTDGSPGGLNICAVGNLKSTSISFRLGPWLEGEVYDGNGGPLTSSNGPHYMASNVTIPVGRTLTIESGAIIEMAPDISIIANGTMNVDGTNSPVQFWESYIEQANRATIRSKMRIQNGATFKVLKYAN